MTKALRTIRSEGFSLVAGVGEISNLVLLRSLAKVIAFIDER